MNITLNDIGQHLYALSIAERNSILNRQQAYDSILAAAADGDMTRSADFAVRVTDWRSRPLSDGTRQTRQQTIGEVMADGMDYAHVTDEVMALLCAVACSYPDSHAETAKTLVRRIAAAWAKQNAGDA